MNNLKIHKQTYTTVFYSVFKSMQLSGSYVLYYDLFEKWDTDDLVSFHNMLTEHDSENKEGNLPSENMRQFVKQETGIDPDTLLCKIHPRILLKMANTRYSTKHVTTVMASAKDAIELYARMATYTLVIDYHCDSTTLTIWAEKLNEFCKLYGQGLNDDHVFKYFKDLCDLKITED